MPIDVTCQCGRTTSVPEKYAGKRGKCPACGSVMLVPVIDDPGEPIPDLGISGDPEEFARPVPVPPRASVAATGSHASQEPAAMAPLPTNPEVEDEEEEEEEITPIVVDDVPPSRVPSIPAPATFRRAIPPEPWFYGWLDGLAIVVWLISKGILVLSVILTVVVAVIGLQSSADPNRLLMILAFPVIVAASLMSSFVGSALLMLAVDAARNIRENRYR